MSAAKDWRDATEGASARLDMRAPRLGYRCGVEHVQTGRVGSIPVAGGCIVAGLSSQVEFDIVVEFIADDHVAADLVTQDLSRSSAMLVCRPSLTG